MSHGWSHDKRVRVEKAFYTYLEQCYVDSRDYGRISLGECIFEGQRRVITGIFDALEADIHEVYVLKSRQLGISTIIRALVIFLEGIKPGLKGAIVFDTDNNKNQSREELEVMIRALPKALKFPGIKKNNRTSMILDNDSQVLFMSAGVKKSKTSGTLGRSVGLAMAHCSELCSWDNDDGLEAFKQSLSDVNPDRLYIYESTARGFNSWYEMWQSARKDPHHCKCIFLGWWSKDSQRIERDHPDFALYGTTPPTDKEIEKIRQVKELYAHDVTVEQLAWVRRKYDPTATREGDADPEFEASATRVQEQPWTEEEAFQQTGAIFFSNEVLTDITNKYVDNKYRTYMFAAGQEFQHMQVLKATTAKTIDLKVWEEPDPDGEYVMGIDPAFGENELNDRSSIQICRCYADGLDQVAEYASPLHTTQQLAWIIAALLGWYGSGANARIRYALELNGPGGAVFTELKNLRHQINSGFQTQEFEERGLKDVFRNVRTYMYNRVDAVGNETGFNYHIKTQLNLKITFMERLRDFTSRGAFRVHSLDLINEMKTIAREGDVIKAPGSMKDDRVLAAAFAIHCWETGPRKQLVAARRTRDAELARRRVSIVDQVNMFHHNQLTQFFEQKKRARVAEQRVALKTYWRHR